jgi:tetratricopeptide (TPR) repeat protein
MPFSEGSDFEANVSKIKGLYKRLIKLNQKDVRSWRASAHFHRDIGDFQEAELRIKKAAELRGDRVEYLYTLIDWGICWRQWSDHVRREGHDSVADEYLRRAVAKLEDAQIYLGKIKGESARETELRVPKQRWLTAYTKTLGKLAGISREPDRYNLNKKTEELFLDRLDSVSDEAYVLNRYAGFVLKAGDYLDREESARGGEHSEPPPASASQHSRVERAISLLESAAEKARVEVKQPDPFALNVLGRLYYLVPQSQSFERAQDNLLKARDASVSQARDSYDLTKHKAATSHELARMYLDWCSESDNPLEREDLLSKAKDAIEEARSVPDNPLWKDHRAATRRTSILIAIERGGLRRGREVRGCADCR